MNRARNIGVVKVEYLMVSVTDLSEGVVESVLLFSMFLLIAVISNENIKMEIRATVIQRLIKNKMVYLKS